MFGPFTRTASPPKPPASLPVDPCRYRRLSWLHNRAYPWRYVLPLPLAVLVIVFTIWRSTLLTIFRGVSWGGPPVPLAELKKARIRHSAE